MSASCVWCLFNRGLCDGPIPRPEELYRMFVCVIDCDQVRIRERESEGRPTVQYLSTNDKLC
jgi:hypothetical protein